MGCSALRVRRGETSSSALSRWLDGWSVIVMLTCAPFNPHFGFPTDVIIFYQTVRETRYKNQFMVPLATMHLLENTDGVLRLSPPQKKERGSEHPISVLSGRQPAISIYADGRSSDDVIAF